MAQPCRMKQPANARPRAGMTALHEEVNPFYGLSVSMCVCLCSYKCLLAYALVCLFVFTGIALFRIDSCTHTHPMTWSVNKRGVGRELATFPFQWDLGDCMLSLLLARRGDKEGFERGMATGCFSK